MTQRIYHGLPPIERKSDGSLYHMTASQKKRAVNLIRHECCSYIHGDCLELDDGVSYACPQSKTRSVCCKIFRFMVLPLDKALEGEIFSLPGMKKCTLCGRAFIANSNRAKYCSGCAATVHKRQKAYSARKRRARVDN